MASKKHSAPPAPMEFRRFRMDQIMRDSVVCMIGRRRSGKSWAIRSFIHELAQRGVPYGKIFSGTEHCNPFFSSFFPKLFIEEKVDDEKIRQIIKQQDKLVKTARKKSGGDGRRLSNNMLLVFDDMMADAVSFKKSRWFKELFMNGRHHNICFVIAMQYVMGIPPEMRDNVDFAFLFANDGANLRKIYDNFAGVIPTFDMFNAIFKQFTRNQGCMVINKTNSSDDLRDQVFYYKASDPGPFRFGSAPFWETHEKRYREPEDDETDDVQQLLATHGIAGQRYNITIAT